MTSPSASPRLLVRELVLALLALLGVGAVVAVVMVGLILLLYAPR
jgi:hypothetical protein